MELVVVARREVNKFRYDWLKALSRNAGDPLRHPSPSKALSIGSKYRSLAPECRYFLNIGSITFIFAPATKMAYKASCVAVTYA